MSPDLKGLHVLYASYAGPFAERLPQSFSLTDQLPWVSHVVVEQRQPFLMETRGGLPPDAARDRATFEALGTRSILVAPIEMGSDLPYVIAVSSVQHELRWPRPYVHRLQLLGRVFANTVERRRSIEALRESEARFDLATRSAGIIPWDIDVSAGRIWLTPAGKELYGLARDVDVTGDMFFGVIHPEDVGLVRDRISQIVASASELDIEYRVLLPGGGVRWIAARGRFRAGPDASQPHVTGISIDATARVQADAERRAATARLQAAMDAAGLGFYVMTDGGETVTLEDKARDLLGVPSDQRVRVRAFWLEHVHPEDLDRVLEISRQVVSGQLEQGSIDYRYRHPTHGLAWYNHTVRAVDHDTNGHVTRIIGVLQDITERRSAEETIRQSEARLASAIDVARLGFCRVDDGVRMTYADDRCRDLFGMSEDQAQGTGGVEHWICHLHPDDCRPLLDLQDQLNDGRQDRAVVTYRYLHPERGLIWIHQVTDVIQRYESGKAQTTIGVVRNVTDEKWREEALRASEEVNRATFEQAAMGIAHLGTDGRWLRVNDELCAILGYTRDELTAVTFQDVTHPDDVAISVDYMRRVLAGWVATYSIEKRFIRKDGSTIWAILAVSLVRDGAGHPKHFIAVMKDITYRKHTEEALAKSNAELQRLRDQLERENIYLRLETRALKGSDRIVGKSQAIRTALMDAEKVAPTPSTVLLLGETGTGKERFADAIHQMSPRRDRPMVRVSCAAIPVTLIESELFGRERGAYTGALSKQVGRFELANGSTIFLDEIGDLPLDIQVKLLRVLQERQIERLGNPRPVPVDVRIIAATNHDLERDVQEGRFREDLYYRINVFPVRVPPLRDRSEDIPLLVESLIEELAGVMGKRIESVSRASMNALLDYGWPGNVRELRNVVERAMILATGSVLEIAVPGVRRPPASSPSRPATAIVEREELLRVLEQAGWRIRGKDGAAARLGLKPTTLESRMAKLGVRRP